MPIAASIQSEGFAVKERLIYCPNCFTLDEWEKLSREEQIQWWRDQRAKEPPRLPVQPLTVVRNYERGMLTDMSFGPILFSHLTAENIHEFLKSCPADVLNQLREYASRLPPDGDPGWSDFIMVSSACYPPWVTEEEILQSQRDRDRRFHDGLRIFRAHQPLA
jgi:hypothetical protein